VAIQIEPYTEQWTGPVADFNRRVESAHLTFRVPDTPLSPWLPKVDGRNIYQEWFLALEGDCVRGAYTFKHQEFSFGGRILPVGACQMPVSEGIIDPRYGLVGVRIVNDALRRQPLSYGLGIGDPDAAITRILRTMGWRERQIPFYFKVRHGFRFCRNIRYLRTSLGRRAALDAAAFSGAAWAGAGLASAAMTSRRSISSSLRVEPVNEFSAWADDLWQVCQYRYSMIGVRNADVLNILYPPENPRFLKLKVRDGGEVVGWAVVLDTVMNDNKYFGNMRVGSIADCLAPPKFADKVVSAAVAVLENRGVDLMLSNQIHPAWRRAFKRGGFLEGPSNFLFLTSPPLTDLLNEIDPAGSGIHITRGDGDGPIHL
jgi:hypothetical protein